MHHLRDISFVALLILLHRIGIAALAQAPPVLIKPQPDAPMLISVVRITSNDPRAPEFEYRVLNQSNKPIRAYTIRHDDGLVGSTMSMLNIALQPE